MRIPMLLYIVTCGARESFVQHVGYDYRKALAVECRINKPKNIFSWDGVKIRKIAPEVQP